MASMVFLQSDPIVNICIVVGTYISLTLQTFVNFKQAKKADAEDIRIKDLTDRVQALNNRITLSR